MRPLPQYISQLAQVVSALSYLHGLSIIHGDVKGVSISIKSLVFLSHQLQSNILITDNGEASLTDFGLSRILHTSGFTTDTASGTLRYLAPELFSISAEGEDEPIPRVTIPTDVWAFAMTVVEVRRLLSRA